MCLNVRASESRFRRLVVNLWGFFSHVMCSVLIVRSSCFVLAIDDVHMGVCVCL